jgi:hypothetical protein
MSEQQGVLLIILKAMGCLHQAAGCCDLCTVTCVEGLCRALPDTVLSSCVCRLCT